MSKASIIICDAYIAAYVAAFWISGNSVVVPLCFAAFLLVWIVVFQIQIDAKK
jgi:hypothetical protein